MGVTEEYKLSMYEDYGVLGEKTHIHLVRDKRNGRICVKKERDFAQKEIVDFRRQNQVSYYPELLEVIGMDGKLTIIEEYIEGVTLNEYMMGEKLPEEQAVEFAKQICSALLPLHHAEPPIIYRDLKTENIMVTREGMIKLIDFNISRAFQEGKKRDTVLLGTAEYAAPEQFGYFQTDNRTDIYAFGVLFNYMLTGKFPVEQMSEGRYAELIRKCTEMEPSRRYQKIEDVLQELGGDITEDGESSEKLVREEEKDNRYNSWVIPGFRSGKTWKKIVAVLGYFFIGYMTIAAEFYEEDGSLYTIEKLWLNRIIIGFAFLLCVFYSFNYKNIAGTINIFSYRTKWIHVIESVLMSLAMFFAAFFLLAIIESVFGL